MDWGWGERERDQRVCVRVRECLLRTKLLDLLTLWSSKGGEGKRERERERERESTSARSSSTCMQLWCGVMAQGGKGVR